MLVSAAGGVRAAGRAQGSGSPAVTDAFEQRGGEIALAGIRQHRQDDRSPAGRSAATFSAAATVAPEEMPQKMPSWLASARALRDGLGVGDRHDAVRRHRG